MQAQGKFSRKFSIGVSFIMALGSPLFWSELSEGNKYFEKAKHLRCHVR